MANLNRNIKKVVIVGGGSAGWMTASALVNAFGNGCQVDLIESEEIGIVGVGEATIPPIKMFNQMIGLNEKEFLSKTQGTFKLGIEFVNWYEQGHRYFHPFGQFGANFDPIPLHQHWLNERAKGNDPSSLDDYSMCWALASRNKMTMPTRDPRMVQSTFDYAYHFDATLYAGFLRAYAEERGVKRNEGIIVEVNKDDETGFIKSVTMKDGREISGDFFVDCSGIRALLIEGALEAGYTDWTNWLPCNRALAVPCEHGGDFTPYTRSTAREAGWQWRIPLQHRIGNGYVYCSEFISNEEASDVLLANIDGKQLADTRYVPYTPGRRNKVWVKNCVAIGLSSGFLEPLESTSIHLIQSGILRLLALFPDLDFNPVVSDEYNRLTALEYERVRDFLILHYKATKRDDTELWRYCSAMDIPDTLQHKINHFESYGRLATDSYELFQPPSWLAVFIGQHVWPKQVDPILALKDTSKSAKTLEGLRRVMNETADASPGHAEFIAKHCPAEKM